MPKLTRRDLLGAAAATAAVSSLPRFTFAADELSAIYAEIGRRHDESVRGACRTGSGSPRSPPKTAGRTRDAR